MSEATNALAKCFDAHMRTLLGLEWSRVAATSPKRNRARLDPNEDEIVDILGNDSDDDKKAVKKRRARSKSPQPPRSPAHSTKRRSRSPSPAPSKTSRKRTPSPELVRANSSFI